MQKTIKFRGYSKGLKKWIYGGAYIFNGEATVFDESDIANPAYDVDIKSIGQFTGQKDKNKKEIFNGDILKNGTDKHITVRWDDRLASFCLIREDWVFRHFFGESVDADQLEIVGNVYENPGMV